MATCKENARKDYSVFLIFFQLFWWNHELGLEKIACGFNFLIDKPIINALIESRIELGHMEVLPFLQAPLISVLYPLKFCGGLFNLVLDFLPLSWG